MKIRKLKIILDTNIWISFLITRDFEKLETLLLNGNVRLLFSHELIEEFLTMLTTEQ